MTLNKNELMAKLSENANLIIASPQTIAKLKEQGIPFERTSSTTIEDKFNARKAEAIKIVPHLPTLPDIEMLPHAIKSLYEEIIDCILFGVNGAAITMCGNLIEFTLKHATFVKESGGYQNYDPNKWDDFEKIELSEAINRAKRAGLVSSELGKRLNAFREDIRNPYGHFNIRKITREVIAGRVKVANLETDELEEKDIPAEQDPNIQAIVKPIIDKRNVMFVYQFADEVVKYVLTKLEINPKLSTHLINDTGLLAQD